MKLKQIVTLREEVEEGQAPKRWWYGMAYRDLGRDCKIYYPIPLNEIVYLFHRFYCWFRRWHPAFYETLRRKNFEEGWQACWESQKRLEQDRCNNCMIQIMQRDRNEIIEQITEQIKEKMDK